MKKVSLLTIIFIVMVFSSSTGFGAEKSPQKIIDLANSTLVNFGTDPVIVNAVKTENAKGKTLDQIKEMDEKWKGHAGLADYEENLEQAEALWDGYKKLPVTPEEMEIISEFEKVRDEWKQISRKVVVANEIKELARQTADATGEIKGRIESIQESTSGTVTEIGSILEVIKDVNDIVSNIASAVEEQSVTTREIAGNISQVSQGIQDVNEDIAQSNTVAGDIAMEISDVNQANTEISNNSSQVSHNAESLAKLAAQLKEMVVKFRVQSV